MVFMPLKRTTMSGTQAARAAETRTHAREYLKLRSTDRKALAELLALNCAKRGARWLNHHAPSRGWWRNCLNGGHSRVCTGHDNSGILSLAFEYEPEMAGGFGYVIDATVLSKFGFRFPSRAADRLAFTAGTYVRGWNPFPKRYPDIEIDCKTVDGAWNTLLQNPTGEMLSNFRHPIDINQYFASLAVGDRKIRLALWPLRLFGQKKHAA